jgi:murein DD-endopeptidase MepM/ murein hydrolase activator NlpD
MASDGGTVTYAGWCDCGLGWYVEIDHGNGYATVYGHMAEMPWVATGAKVNQGDVIGPIGSSGASTGPHVHFMVKQNGSTIDPFTVLP